MHRYEMAHEKSLYAALRQLAALERSGADLGEPDDPDPPPAAPDPPADHPAQTPINNRKLRPMCRRRRVRSGAWRRVGVGFGRAPATWGSPPA